MKDLELNLMFLNEYNLNAYQGIIIEYANRGTNYQWAEICKLKGFTSELQANLKDLYDKKIIKRIPKVINRPDAFELTPLAENRINTGKSQFEELYDTYPSKVVRPDGSTDYLKAHKEECWWAYLQATKGRRSTHDQIIKALKWEIEDRKNHGKLGYMRKLLYWLKDESWNIYDDSEAENDNLYGDDIE